MKPVIVTSFFALLLLIGGLPRARAASAVAASIDNFGYCYNLGSEQAAVQCAMRSCENRSQRTCHIVAACARGGYGAIFARVLPGRTLKAVGAACGSRDRAHAYRKAAIICNREAHANQCNGPHGEWFDRRP